MDKISEKEFKLLGGAFHCPNIGRAVLSWSGKDDDKFICDSCGNLHIKRFCKVISYTDSDSFGILERRRYKLWKTNNG